MAGRVWRSSVAWFSESDGVAEVTIWFLYLHAPDFYTIATATIRCYGCVAHGTTWLYHSVRFLRDLYSLGARSMWRPVPRDI